MPPRRPPPRRNKHSTTSSAASSDKPSQASVRECENDQQTCFVIGGGEKEIRWLWPMLSRFEKFHILDVTADEILMTLFRMTNVPEETRAKIEVLLNDPNYATNIRMLFVAGLHPSTSEIPLPADFPSPSLAFLQVLDKHLVEAYYRYHSSALLVLFLFSWSLLSPYSGYLFKAFSIISFSIALGVFTGRKLWLIPVDLYEPMFSNSPERILSLMTNMMLYSLSYWSPHASLIRWVSFVPYLLLILKDYVPAEDIRPLHVFHSLVSIALRLVLLYFAWHSWIFTLIVLSMLIPTLFALIVHIILLICQAGILALDFIVQRVDFLNRLTNSMTDFAVFPVVLFYALYFQSYWAGALAVLLMPALGRSAVMTLASTIVPELMARGSAITCLTFLHLGMTLCTVLVGSCVCQFVKWIRFRRQR